jgi:hypothetical protein
MVFMRFAVPVGFVVLLVSSAKAQQSSATVRQPADKKSVLVQIDPAVRDKGLNVVGPIRVSAKDGWPAGFAVTVVNLLEEEVFLTVRSVELQNLGYRLAHELSDGMFMGIAGSGSAPSAMCPDNTGLLKRLHACSYKEGRPLPCGCAVARVQGTLGDADDSLDLSTAVGSKGTVTLPIKGYFRANGEEFSKDVEIPILITE